MKFNWFIRKGIVFIPSSLVGWLILAISIAYAVYLFIDIDSHSHSASDTSINWVFNLLIIGLVYSLVGFFTERKGQGGNCMAL